MDYPEKVKRIWESKQENGVVNAGRAMEAMEETPQPRHGDTWGDWWYDQKNRVLEHRGTRYYVILHECINSANVLDWIAQIKHKSWASTKDLGDLITALDDLFDLQGNVCGSGKDHRFDAKSYLDLHDEGKYEGGYDSSDEEEGEDES